MQMNRASHSVEKAQCNLMVMAGAIIMIMVAVISSCPLASSLTTKGIREAIKMRWWRAARNAAQPVPQLLTDTSLSCDPLAESHVTLHAEDIWQGQRLIPQSQP